MDNIEQNTPMIPYSKMGIKILSDSQLQNIFPACETLLGRIKTHRDGVKKINRTVLERDIQYNLMFDNVYSIMGKRGAGKTSVVFTLKEKLNRENNGEDIVLPIIMPEMIPKECSMIGWVLALLEDEVEKIEKRISNELIENFSNSNQFDGCMRTGSDSLSSIYAETKRLYYAQYYNVRHTDSFVDAVVNTDKMTQNSYSFSRKLVDFWGTLIRYKKRVKECNEEPLVHIIFDDVDLVPERAIDLFSTIIKYLSHPNIVVYVTADEDLIFDVLENNMTRRLEKKDDLFMYNHVIGGLKREYGDEDTDELKSFNDDINKIRKKMLIKEKLIHETPRRYGEKVLPPSCRYYLETFDDIDKKKSFIIDWYDYDETTGLRTDTPKAVSIEWFLKHEIDRYIKTVGIGKSRNKRKEKKAQKKKNFVQLISNDEYKDEFISAYLLFWGTISRQLTNEVFIISEFLDNLIKLHKPGAEFSGHNQVDKSLYCRNIFQVIWNFAYRTLNVASSVELPSDEIQTILEEVLLYDEHCGGIYIDYLYLREKAFKDCDDIRGVNGYDTRLDVPLKQNIALFVLSFFIENILKLENEINIIEESQERKKVHGMGLLVDVLDYYVGGEWSLVCKKLMNDVPSFLWYYGKILDQPHTLLDYDLFVPRSVREYFIALPKIEINKTLEELYSTSPMWTHTITQMLYFANERIHIINQTVLDIIHFSRDNYFDDIYYRQQVQNLLDDLTNVLSVLSDESEYQKLKNQYDKLYVNNEQSTQRVVFNYNYLQGQTIGNLQKKMKGAPAENGNETFESLCTEEERKNRSKLPNNFGTNYSSNALLGELRYIRERIMTKLDEFRWYRINNFDYVEMVLKNANIQWPEEITRLRDVESDETDKKACFITREGLSKTVRRINSERNNSRGRYSYLNDSKRDDYYDEVYQTVTNNCAFVIFEEEKGSTACEVIRLFNYYSMTQRLYLFSYLKQTETTGYSFIDTNMIPYKSFYSNKHGEIETCLKEKGYLGNTLRRGIAEMIRQYINGHIRNIGTTEKI